MDRVFFDIEVNEKFEYDRLRIGYQHEIYDLTFAFAGRKKEKGFSFQVYLYTFVTSLTMTDTVFMINL